MNRKYGKLVDGRIKYAPKILDTPDGIKMNPSEESYLKAGWKIVIDEKPQADASSYVAVSKWQEDETTLKCVYKTVQGKDPSIAPRIFSKLKMVLALKKVDLWVLTRAWIGENGLYDYYLAAQNFSEDHEFFIEGKKELQRLSGRTEEEIEAILAECIAD